MISPQLSKRTTVVIIDKSSTEVLCYEDIEGFDTPLNLVSDYVERFAEQRVIPRMKNGESRAYLLFSRSEGMRPDVSEIRIVNTPRRTERKITGSRGPGFIEEFPYTIEWDDSQTVKKGEFPRPPGIDPSIIFDDGGIDEEAIQAAIRSTYRLLRNAVADRFCEPSRHALLQGLADMMRSTDSDGEPSEQWYYGNTIEETAVDLYDATILLWIESAAAADLPQNLLNGYKERIQDDPKRLEEIRRLAKAIEGGSLL